MLCIILRQVFIFPLSSYESNEVLRLLSVLARLLMCIHRGRKGDGSSNVLLVVLTRVRGIVIGDFYVRNHK